MTEEVLKSCRYWSLLRKMHVQLVLLNLLGFVANLVHSFAVISPIPRHARQGTESIPSLPFHHSSSSSQTVLAMVGRTPRRNIQVPLLDVLDESSEYTNQVMTPFPSSHLPNELTTPYLYGMELDRPLHKLLLEEAIASSSEASARSFGDFSS